LSLTGAAPSIAAQIGEETMRAIGKILLAAVALGSLASAAEA
jgi:hypothetical protein